MKPNPLSHATLLFLCVCLGGFYFPGFFQLLSGAPAPQTYAFTPDNVDPDALAARMKTFQDIYPQVRDQALAAYAMAHPDAHPYDDNAQKLIKLLTYLWLWGDPYRESLWPLEKKLAQSVRGAGGDDPVVGLVLDATTYGVVDDDTAKNMHQRVDDFAATSYPDAFKEFYYQAVVDHLIKTKAGLDGASPADVRFASIPDMIQKWGQLYEQQIKKPLPNALLFSLGSSMQGPAEHEESTLILIHNRIDQAFAANAPDSPVLQVLDGSYWVNEAWNARGAGWANTVTDPQWAKFKEDLEKADSVLEAAYAKHPEEAAISTTMLTVELGQGQGKERMEQWFQRAIKADPLNAQAYTQKYWYLQPRWYGSVDDLVSFGQECLSAPQVPPAALSGFGIAIAQASDHEPDVYNRPEVWIPLEKMYRQYLTQFPQSIITRTGFAKHAAQSKRWDIVKEQFDLMGGNWDRQGMTQAEYDAYSASANQAQGK